MAGEYSPARCTRDKPEAGEYSSASYLHPTANLLLLLTQPAGEYSPAGHTNQRSRYTWLGSTPRPDIREA